MAPAHIDGATPAAPQDHGGNLREVRERFGLEAVVDFSASINPLGTPPGLWEHLGHRWEEVLHYPDRRCVELCAAAAGRFDVPPASVLAGNGSAELIDLLFRVEAPRRLVLCPPDFALYEDRAPPGLPVFRVPRLERRGFAPDLEALLDALREGDLVFLSNPGNPSGHGMAPAIVERLLDGCERTGAVLALDEAFADFCPHLSLLPGRAGHPQLVLFRSLTKYYGIPGLRVGFLVTSPERVRRLAETQLPWSVNALAQAAGVYCLAQRDWDGRTLEYVEDARRRLAAALAAVPGLHPLESAANYLMVELRPPAPGARCVYEALAREGVLVRHCGSFGLGERYLRVAVRTHRENELLAARLGRVIGRGRRVAAEGHEDRARPDAGLDPSP